LDAGGTGRRPESGTAELGDLVSRHLQDCAGQIAVGEPKLIQNREMVRVCDWDQVAGEMLLRAVSMIVPAAGNHRWQLARTIRDGERLVDAGPTHDAFGLKVSAQRSLAARVGTLATNEVLDLSFEARLLPPNLDEFSACSDAESIFGGVVRVSVLVAPLGILLVVHMPSDRPRDQNYGCAGD
jgi:hypothetical protein